MGQETFSNKKHIDAIEASIPSAPTYKVYRAIVSPQGTSNPTVTVLENTFSSDIEFSINRLDVGILALSGLDEFTSGLCYAQVSSNTTNSVTVRNFNQTYMIIDVKQPSVSGADVTFAGIDLAGGLNVNIFFEFRYYTA